MSDQKKDDDNKVEYKIFIDGEKFESSKAIVTGQELLEMAGLSASDFDIRFKSKKGSCLIGPNENVDLSEEGIEHFITFPKEAQEG